MSIALSLALLAFGIAILVMAGDALVSGSASVARRFGISPLIVGLTIVAFGTSAPELVVSVQAVLTDFETSALALGNVIGSNITNILLVLSVPALIFAIPTDTIGVTRNTVFALFVTIVMIALLFIHQPFIWWQGAILFAGIIFYLTWMFRLARSGAEDPALRDMAELDSSNNLPLSGMKATIFIVLGIIGLAAGGHLIVDNASKIATALSIPETIIGLTLVAIGTSLPELTTVIVAAYKKETEVAIGNVVGSNIFNILAVLGAASFFGPIKIDTGVLSVDVWVMLASMIVLLGLIIVGKPIGRKVGIAMLIGYIAYIALLGHRMMASGAALP